VTLDNLNLNSALLLLEFISRRNDAYRKDIHAEHTRNFEATPRPWTEETTNLPPKEWGSIFTGAAASAILDRLSFNGRFLTFEGRSYRLSRKQKSR
jgi:IstB-like ATP binding protein